MDLSSDKEVNIFNKDDFRIILSKSDNADNPDSVACMMGKAVPKVIRSRVMEQSSTVITRNTQGYTAEVSIPWSTFNSFKPVSGAQIGFNIAVDDRDDEVKKRKYQFGWKDCSQSWLQPKTFGLLFIE